MNVRAFRDTYSRKLEIFMDLVESGEYVPLHGTNLDELTRHEWWQLFQNWLEKQS